MNVVKASVGGQPAQVTEEDLELINKMTRRELKAEEVYTFSVRLCDNEVDRDWERFSAKTLEELAELFVGKSGIFDHQWSAKGQAARIYKTEMVHEGERITKAGDGYCWLKGYAYMVPTEQNRDLIQEIEGGIKKEVSVGCAVKRAVCSLCGKDRHEGDCGHQKGQVYDGQLCFVSLEEALDAYEFSFVAVPAQPAAGVVKGLEKGAGCLKELVQSYPGCRKELEQLEHDAAMGRRYEAELKAEVVRLGVLAGLGMERKMLQTMVDEMNHEELETLKAAYGRRAEERYPLKPQLEYGEKAMPREDRDGAFLI